MRNVPTQCSDVADLWSRDQVAGFGQRLGVRDDQGVMNDSIDRDGSAHEELVFSHLDVSAAGRRALDPGVTWWGWHVPALLEAGVVLALGLLMLGIAIWEFNASE